VGVEDLLRLLEQYSVVVFFSPFYNVFTQVGFSYYLIITFMLVFHLIFLIFYFKYNRTNVALVDG